VGRLETVFSFCSPLLLLAKAPQDEDARENGGEHECEPGAIGDFGERRGEVDAVEATKEEEEEDDDQEVDAPYQDCDKGDQTGGDECYKDDADAVGVAEPCGVTVHSCDNDTSNHQQPIR